MFSTSKIRSLRGIMFLSATLIIMCSFFNIYRILRKIYWHLNFHLIFTGLCYICILLFMARFYPATTATYFAAISATLQLFSICLFGQILRNHTEAVGDCLYQTRWYEMRLKEQKALLIVMAHAQEPVGLVAGGIMDLSLTTFAAVTITIFIFLLLPSFEKL